MKNNPVGWFEIYVDDMARAKKFYETVFNGKLTKLVGEGEGKGLEMWAFPSDMSAYGANGSLVKLDGCPAGGNSVIVYFTTEDCVVEEKIVLAAGGKIEDPKMAIGQYGFISLVYDTEGNMIGLHSMK